MNVQSGERLQDEICRFLSSILGSDVGPCDDLRAKGLDSVAFLELVIFLERSLSIPLPLELVTAAPLTTAQALSERLMAILAQTKGASA